MAWVSQPSNASAAIRGPSSAAISLAAPRATRARAEQSRSRGVSISCSRMLALHPFGAVRPLPRKLAGEGWGGGGAASQVAMDEQKPIERRSSKLRWDVEALRINSADTAV